MVAGGALLPLSDYPQYGASSEVQLVSIDIPKATSIFGMKLSSEQKINLVADAIFPRIFLMKTIMPNMPANCFFNVKIIEFPNRKLGYLNCGKPPARASDQK